MFRLSPTIKGILIVNVVVFIMQMMFKSLGITEYLAMYRLDSIYFYPYQFFTYMFAHAGFSHILFNMLGLVFLGVTLEQVWGGKKFLIFYVLSGMGAGVFYALIGLAQTSGLKSDINEYMVSPSPENFMVLVDGHKKYFEQIEFRGGMNIYDFIDEYDENPEMYKSESVSIAENVKSSFVTRYGGRVIGASGAVYAILMAFGMLFPDRQLMLLFPPIPIKAKYLVFILGGIAIYMGINQPGDQIAHLVHLGGMVFAYLLVKFW
ncbi:MAG: rhomboid family intramembrane serine protease [Cyclobacteriaceae bacterium]|nr:rhomboid family intramembrane serine protease [Cyclobacteriaceae bacterium]